MEITFIGTGAAEGIPDPWCACPGCQGARRHRGRSLRRRCQTLIDSWLLIDCGPDLVAGCQALDLDLSAIGVMLITHEHSDHLYLPNLDIRGAEYEVSAPGHDLLVCGSPSAIATIKAGLESSAARLELRELLPYAILQVGRYHVGTLPANHASPPVMPYMYVITDGQHSLLYAQDTGPFLDETWDFVAKLAAGVFGQPLRFDLVVADATMGVRADRDAHHMGLAEVIQHRARLAEIGALAPGARVLANHFSHSCVPSHEELVAFLEGSGVEPTYDGLTVRLGAPPASAGTM